MSNLTIVILDWDSGQEPQKVKNLLHKDDEKLWVHGLDGCQFIEVNVFTENLLKIFKVVHNFFF